MTPPTSPHAEGSASARYSSLETDRQIFLQRARECAEYTIPMVFPPQGHSSSTRYATPYQSTGARGVNNLASKLLLTLLPPEASFFKLNLDAKLEQQLDGSPVPPDGSPSDADLMDQALSDIEQSVLKEINGRSVRVHSYELFKQLIIGGNSLLFIPPKKGIRVFRLDQYVVLRDPAGNVLEIVVKETIAPNALPESVKASVLAAIKNDTPNSSNPDAATGLEGDRRTVDLFTWVRREENSWTICQEVKGFKIPDSDGTYPIDKSPWLPLRWSRIDGESYGRGLCEEYVGDLASLESLSKLLVQAGAVAGKVLIMVNPNGTTRVEALANKPNGAITEGNKEDVTILQLDKQMDLTFVSNLAQAIETRISFAFLLNSSIQRNGERVTAEEIRYMASDLEDALGGVYSLLAEDYQLPLAQIVMNQMERENKLPKLPKDTVHPTIVTGLDALGRTHEGQRLDQFIASGLQTFGPSIMPYINISDWLSRKAASLGIKSKGLIKSAQEVQAQQQQEQQQNLASNLGGPAINAGAKVATAQMQQQQQNQQQPQQGQQ